MYAEVKKLHIIEEVLKIDSEAELVELENFLNRSKNNSPKKDQLGFNSFSGIWSDTEAEEIERIIADSCENIHPDDWK